MVYNVIAAWLGRDMAEAAKLTLEESIGLLRAKFVDNG